MSIYEIRGKEFLRKWRDKEIILNIEKLEISIAENGKEDRDEDRQRWVPGRVTGLGLVKLRVTATSWSTTISPFEWFPPNNSQVLSTCREKKIIPGGPETSQRGRARRERGKRVSAIYKEDHNGQGRKGKGWEQNGEINGLEALVELNELMQQKTLVNKLKITLPQSH